MGRPKETEKNSVTKVTLYKLCADFPAEDALSNYKAPKEFSAHGWNYTIFIKSIPNRPPAWHPLVKDIINVKDIPKNSYASLIILFKKDENCFALTAGYGYVDVREYAIKDFGIDIACKSLNPNKLDQLYQKVPTGNVYGLIRSLRGKYIPANDGINQKSVLKALRGKVINQQLGLTMEGRTSLAISGKKNLVDVIKLLDEVINIEKSDKFTVNIKGLDEVSKELRNELEQELLNKINDDNFDDVLFGYEDDLVFNNCEKLKVGNVNIFYSIDDIKSVLGAAKTQNQSNPADVKISGYNDQDIEIFKKKLIDLIEGELDYKNDKYFRIDRRWYKTNIKYKQEIEIE